MFTAPEIFNGQRYNLKADVYSFGVLLCCMLGGSEQRIRSQFRKQGGVFAAAGLGWRPELTPEVITSHPQLWALVCAAWNKDAAARPNFQIITKLLRRGSKSRALSALPIYHDAAAPLTHVDPGFSLASMTSVTPDDLQAVRELRSELTDMNLALLPEHAGGDVALLRFVRNLDQTKPPAVNFRAMLEARHALGCDAMHRKILDEGLALHAMPGTQKAETASIHANDWISTDAKGDIVCYERFGAIVPSIASSMFSPAEFERWYSYRREARSMLLDLLSKRSLQLLQFVVASAEPSIDAHSPR